MTKPEPDYEDALDQPADVEPGHESAVDVMQGEIDNLKLEKQGLFEKLARAQADFQNSRKRLETENEQRIAYAAADAVKAFVPIIDNFELTARQDPSKVASADIIKGMSVVLDDIAKMLAKLGVAPIAPGSGDAFDPMQHQAIMQQPSDLPEGQVTMLLQKGYALRDRVLRPAQVAVSKGE